jgi:hypothetical protein
MEAVSVEDALDAAAALLADAANADEKSRVTC